jgi:ADP-ribosyl-[dinitrogen reductase] hydrolase
LQILGSRFVIRDSGFAIRIRDSGSMENRRGKEKGASMTAARDVTAMDRAQGALLGLASGDAVGTTVEFKLRGTFHPLRDMVGGGPFRLQAGQWTDDTIMALCLAESLLECGGFDPRDQMERYLRWFRTGYMSPTGRCFDIGNTVLQALLDFERSGNPFSGPTGPEWAGNGSIMRLAPVVLFYHPDREAVDRFAAESSKTTHGGEEPVVGCRILAGILAGALAGLEKEALLLGVPEVEEMSGPLRELVRGGYMEKARDEIRATGYVVSSLEAALWSFWTTSSFEEAILTAANLGDDADTTAAVCGQVAGAFYGLKGIPEGWLEKLWEREKISDLARRLGEAVPEDAGGAT